jgi:enterochelin esterase-like enzyme
MLNRHQLKDLLDNANLPFVVKEKVYFVYNGKPNQKVELVSDINCWIRGYDVLTELADSGIYYIEKILPLNSRIEYKFIVNNEYILDPGNSHKSSSNLGENSVLEMPGYPKHPEFNYHFNNIPSIEQNYEIESSHLKYSKNIKILLPYSFSNDKKYSVAIFNDGFNYYKYGKLKNIFDYIHNKKLTKDFILVLIMSSYEERYEEFDLNDDYALFVNDELIPFINKKYNLPNNPDFLFAGYFMGAFQAMYNALKSSGYINKLLLQSFSTEAKEKTITEFIHEDKMKNMDIYLSYGKYEKNIDKLNLVYLNECFIEMLENFNVKHKKMIYNQGHNWGMWEADLLNAFIYHFE